MPESAISGVEVLIKLAKDVPAPYVDGAETELQGSALEDWQSLTSAESGTTLSLDRLYTDLSASDLQALVDNSRSVSGDPDAPDLTRWYVIQIPDETPPNPFAAAVALVEKAAKLSATFDCVEMAAGSGEAGPANPAQNPAFIFQGYLLSQGIGGIGVTDAWSLNGGDGQGVRLGVVENFDYDRQHRDLVGAGITALTSAAPVPTGGFPQSLEQFAHATQVLGILKAADNTLDCLGAVPVAQTFFGSPSRADPTMRDLLNALTVVGRQLGQEDVMSLSVGAFWTEPGRATIQYPLEAQAASRDAILNLTRREIIVVQAAGNSGLNLGDPIKIRQQPQVSLNPSSPTGFSHTDAVLVGAADPQGLPAAMTFHRRADSNFGARVDCFGWGSSVVTLLPTNAAPSGSPPIQLHFGKTSAATAIVAGAAVALLGVSRGKGKTQTPRALRELLSDPNFNTDTTPAQDQIGVMPNVTALIPNL